MIDEVREIQEQIKSTPPSTGNPLYSTQTKIHDETLTNNRRVQQYHRQDTETDTFQSSSCNTMIELSSESDTMIINENSTETENDADSQQDTLKVKFHFSMMMTASFIC